MKGQRLLDGEKDG